MAVEAQPDGIHISPEEAAEANDPLVGEGTPDTAPGHDPAAELPLIERQPVRAFGLAQCALVAAAAAALGARKVALPLAAGIYLLDEIAARRVTPLARPRDRQGDPLTPAPAPDLPGRDYEAELGRA